MIIWKELIHIRRNDIQYAVTKYGASNVRILDSVVCGKANEQSITSRLGKGD